MSSETTTWWYAADWREKVEPVAVVKETECTITELVNGRTVRRNKVNNADCYFPTEAEAVAYLFARAERKVEVARANLNRATGALYQLHKNYPPHSVAVRNP